MPAALLADLALRIESSPPVLKREGFVGETLTSRSDRAVGLPRAVDMVWLVIRIWVLGVFGFWRVLVFAIKELGDWDQRVFGLMARWDAE